ncbi:MAG: hypothetical protein ACFFAH_14115 [Promethearchaeota archaeon]
MQENSKKTRVKKFISLLSGGLDSPIAAYLMIKKNLTPIFLSFLTSDDEEYSMKKKIIRIVQILAKLTDKEIKLYLINHDPNLELFKRKCMRKLTCILCKRLMIRIAKEIGKIEHTNIIVTGDILGEQASQTLDNLYTYNDLLNGFIILRPLIGQDKQEIIRLNQKIGLYEIISQSSAGCQYNPQYPETHAKSNEVNGEEFHINYDEIIKKSLEKAEILLF